MKLLLLKALLKRRARDEGFTLPMVIALGLVMILLGTANIVKSSEENLNATIQNSSSDAFAVAEVGITKYREFLNQNRILTVYNHPEWTSNNVNGVDVMSQTCTDMTGAPAGWTGTATNANDTAADATDYDTTDNDNWWEVREDINGDGDTTDTEDLIGEYRLVSYEYDNDDVTGYNNLGVIGDTDDNGIFNVVADVNSDYPADTSNDNDTDDDGESDAVGILTVQGRSPDGSESQVRVEIPIRVNPDEMSNLAPALWIGSSDSSYLTSLNSNLGTLTIPSPNNVVLYDGSSGCADPADLGGGAISVVSDARSVPSIASIVTKVNEAATVNFNDDLEVDPSGTSVTLGKRTEEPYVTPSSGNAADFVESTDCSDINNCRYYYKLVATDINLPTTTDGIAKVTMYVDGNLNINRDIGSNVSSSYLEIYVSSGGNITIDSDNVNEINALIHAPNSQLTVSGSGSVTINGSVWVNELVNNATLTIQPDTTRISSRDVVPSYEAYTATATRPPRPLTNPPTNWTKEEVWERQD